MNRLDGKVALLSGAARGIGGQTAKCMVEAGAKVVIGDVLEGPGKALAKELSDVGGDASFVHLDVTREADWDAAVKVATDTHGNLDILVNNAGVYLGRDLEEVSLDDWHRLVSVNLTGVFLGTKHCAPALRESGKNSKHGSAIINLSSIAGLIGTPLDQLYSMTKGGVTTFTKATAVTFGRRGDRIRVNAIHPGVIETDMGVQTFNARANQAGSNDTDAGRQAALNLHPIGRLGVAEDIALGIVFLASDDAGFMTGSSLVVDGGFTAQ